MTTTFIFDFDGVITDTELERLETINKLIAPQMINRKDIKRFIGKKTIKVLEEFFPEMTAEERKRTANLRRATGITKQPYRQIPTLLEIIKTRGYKVGLCTGSFRNVVHPYLEREGLSAFFDVFVYGEDFVTSKSDQECYLLALKRLKSTASETVVIEDSPAGVAAGKRAGCIVWAIGTYLSAEELRQADRYFNDHEELLNAIKEAPTRQ